MGGGLKENLRVRLTIPSQEVQEGAFVVIESGSWQFYGLVIDLQLGSTDPRFADEQSEARLPLEMARLLHGQTLFTTLEVLPALMLERGPDPASPEYASLAGKSPGRRTTPAGENRPTPPCGSATGGRGGYRGNIREERRRRQFRRGLHPRTGSSGVHQPGQIRPALGGGVRSDRHGEILPHPAGVWRD